ncbi:MAG: PDZ domain-containing protein [bacterium]|nr:PDZ domain-containing protein [bacterium]
MLRNVSIQSTQNPVRQSIAALLFAGVVAATFLNPTLLPAEDNPLREVLEDAHALDGDFWVYNDIKSAREIARKSGKPIFVTFRCVPCKACEAFDAEVAAGKEEIDALARDKFVSVRQVEMKGVDLSLFQFDHDLNWAAMFINADGTIYARYGTQSAEGPDAFNSVAGLVSTMKRVLEIHENYPANKAELVGKTGAKKSYRTAIEMPGMDNKEKLAQATHRKNCIHCHMIHDAENMHLQATNKFTLDHMYRYPLPDNIGLTINADHGRKIASVKSGSPAAQAGLKPGEEITHINGQLIASIADIQWVLNGIPNEAATLNVVGGQSGEKQLKLAPGWKKWDVSWRGSNWSIAPKLRIWLPELTPGEREKRGIQGDDAALLVRWINNGKPAGKEAIKAGVKTGDVIVGVDGKPLPGDSNQLHLYMIQNFKIGDMLPITVRRKGKLVQLSIKLVE